jgi:hypothetical protein
MEKKEKVKQHVIDMLNISHKAMLEKVDKALNSGAINIDDWSEDVAPMVLPKIITIAIMENESRQYLGIGTSHEKRVKKEVKNLQYFL